MRKVIASEYLTLDGVMEAPNKWSFQFWNEEAVLKLVDTKTFSSRIVVLSYQPAGKENKEERHGKRPGN